MGQVKIVTDSTADLPESLVKEFGIHVIPLKVSFGDTVYREGIDITSKEFFEKLKTSQQLPRTSQPSPGEFKELYEELTSDGSGVVSIHLSSLMSGTYQSAVMARKELAAKDITVIDSKTVSMGLGLVALEAAKAAKAGKTTDEILTIINELINKVNIYFVVDTMEYLQKGGRIGKASAFLGTMLNIKPVLTIKEGLVVPFEKIRGKAKALEKLMDVIREFSEQHGPMQCALVHANALDETIQLHEKLISQFKYCEMMICEIGAVVGTHGGPGLIGFVFYEDKAQA